MFYKFNLLIGLAHKKSRVALISLLIVQTISLNPCKAQEKTANSNLISISANSITANKLPFPGQTLTLSAEVSNTRDFRLPIRLLAVRDGKFYEISAPSGLLGANEKPQYKVEIPAPVAEIIYQFVLIAPDGTATSSQRISIRRDCIPNVLPAIGEMPDDMDGSERFNTLLVDNKRMEQEISNLENAATVLDTLSELISQ